MSLQRISEGLFVNRPSSEKRERMIAIAAYCRAERRGFAPGCELADWLAAEAEVEAQLAHRPER